MQHMTQLAAAAKHTENSTEAASASYSGDDSANEQVSVSQSEEQNDMSVEREFQ
jgi:hypothetical protein